MTADPLANWSPHLSLGITGHRPCNSALSANSEAVGQELEALFERIETIRRELAGPARDVRLHDLLAGGVDQLAARIALEKGWSLVAPLPFGAGLNLAMNAGAASRADVAALCEGRGASDPAVEKRAAAIRSLTEAAHVFEIADRDEEIRALLDRTVDDLQDNPRDEQAARLLEALTSDNVELAGRVMIERSDLLVAVWDRNRADRPGGTGHTVITALELGTPVLLIDPSRPDNWTILSRPEELGHLNDRQDEGPDHLRLRTIVENALSPADGTPQNSAREKWRAKSAFGFAIYRRIETLFGGRTSGTGKARVSYEPPETIAAGSAAPLLAAAELSLGPENRLVDRLRQELLPTFAWADGVSSRLSDAYRSGMSINFALSAFAIIVGIAYLPFDLARYKWIFALAELLFLLAILVITFVGLRRKWHRRWFEMRRVAEYLRFAPAILIMGVARPIGRWPRGDTGEWPERFSRDALRAAGLPRTKVDRTYLRSVLEGIILPHVRGQRTYHEAKSSQLSTVHHRIDKSAEACFLAAVVSVSAYLMIEAGAFFGVVPATWPSSVAKVFTFMGVAFPTLGANLAGLRYFGDFERFAAISDVTASKLADVESRISLLLEGDESRLTYHATSDLVRTVDEIIVAEIESWQSVYGAKHLSLPA